jgi:predicted trehalose synthase
MQRRQFTQAVTLDERLEETAERLRREARGTPPGVERDKLLRRAGQAESAAHIQQWLTSAGLRAPK